MPRRLFSLLLTLLLGLNFPASVHAQPAPAPLPAAAGFVETITFTNHYDGSTQEALVQLPDGYTPDNAYPVVVYSHSRYADMEEGIFLYGQEANTWGWLLVSPQLHGHWPTPPNPPGTYAYASLESQYDLLGAVQYVIDHYHVDPSRIYVAGNSMGGLLATLAAAKYPDVFAAVFGNKGPSDLTAWYAEQFAFGGSGLVASMRQECYTGPSNSPIPQPPSGNPFCYARRSTLSFAPNLLHVPVTLHHSQLDREVPVTQTLRLRDTVNALGPDRPVLTYIDTVVALTCPPDYHCYRPDAGIVFNRFAQYTLGATPAHLNLVSDESKPYYWLDLEQSGGDHFTWVEATADPVAQSVTLVVSDTQPLNLKINLGSVPSEDWIGLSHPGLDFLPGSYHVAGAGLNANVKYTSGYLTLNLPATSQTTITVSHNGPVQAIWLPGALR